MLLSSCTMYKLKPLVNFSHDTELSDNMYRMKNVYQIGASSADLPSVLEQVNKLIKKPLSEVEELKKRQESILKQLTYLKEQMVSLRNELNIKSSKMTSTNCKHEETALTNHITLLKPSWNDQVGEVVIHASPTRPPYSLLAINQLWPNTLQLRVHCHTHSSVTSLPPHLSAFSLCPISHPNLTVRLIWKQMESDCTIVISPLNNCLLRGEVNFLRYLQRMVLSPSDIAMEVKINGTLDMCHRLSHVRTARDKQSLIRALNARLGKAMWLNGESMTIADLAAWSSLQSMTDIELTQNMMKWRSRCTATAGIVGAA